MQKKNFVKVRENRTDEYEGSEVQNVSQSWEIPYIQKENPYMILTKQKAKTTRTLAYLLVAILAGSVGLHYGITAWLIIQKNVTAVETLDRIFIGWLPVISSLAGSAVTYYFTKEKD